jgi:protein NrfD
MIDLTGRDRRLARLGYYITLPLMLVIGAVLIVDLSRPDRFWHLLLENHTLRPMYKWWVPMSTGTWAVLLLGFFALLSCLAAFAEHRRPRWRFAQRLRPPGILGVLVAVPGAMVALLVTGYTGVMLSVLNRPVWSDTPLFGLLFVVSAIPMAAALLALVGRWLYGESPAVSALQRIWVWLLFVQILVWIALFATLGPAVRGWLNVWGIVLAIGIAIGTVLPLLAAARHTTEGFRSMSTAATLVLAGGFMVRMAIVFVPEAIAP